MGGDTSRRVRMRSITDPNIDPLFGEPDYDMEDLIFTGSAMAFLDLPDPNPVNGLPLRMVSKQHKLPLYGGSPDQPNIILPSEILARRSGWRKIARAFKGHPTPLLQLKVESFKEKANRFLDTLPTNLILPNGCAQFIHDYRAAIVMKCQPHSLFTVPTAISDPFFKAFPEIFDDHVVARAFAHAWNMSTATWTGRQRKDIKTRIAMLKTLTMRIYPILRTSAGISASVIGHEPSLQRRYQTFVKFFGPGAPLFASRNDDGLTFEPFDVGEFQTTLPVFYEGSAAR